VETSSKSFLLILIESIAQRSVTGLIVRIGSVAKIILHGPKIQPLNIEVVIGGRCGERSFKGMVVSVKSVGLMRVKVLFHLRFITLSLLENSTILTKLTS
jgi:hypothetical protein